MRIKFYGVRAILLLYIIKILSKVLFVEVPPIFSVTALIEKKEKLLFLKLSYRDGFGLPGGIVKGGETLEGAVSREVLEETNLKVVETKYFCSVFSVYKGVPTASVVFMVKTYGTPKTSEEGEPVWLDPKEAIGRMYYKDSGVTLKKYISSR